MTYHLQKTTAGVVILLVNLDVFGELVDSLSENSDLNLRRTCVVLVKAVSLDYGSRSIIRSPGIRYGCAQCLRITVVLYHTFFAL